MNEYFVRTEMLIGTDALEKLKNSKVAVFGLGGVGGYVAEALVRSGVGSLLLVDNDTVAPSNINRQIFATVNSVGLKKTEAARQRLLSLNPSVKIETADIFYLPENADNLSFTGLNYVADCIDTVTGKIEIISRAKALGVPVISCMGTGNKLDATAFKVADISKTKVCPLAKVMRRELSARGISGVKVVYSEEAPISPRFSVSNGDKRRATPASIAFVPSVAGLIMAGEIIKDLAVNVVR